jgi:hypothetical protein
MKEPIVSFETAKLAKDSGFSGYESNKWFYKDGTINESNSFKCWNTHEYTQDIRWSAPTQSLLQKWIREEHGIDIRVDPPTEPDGEYNANIFEKRYSCSWGTPNGYPTYEEALEEGIKEALKLILQ